MRIWPRIHVLVVLFQYTIYNMDAFILMDAYCYSQAVHLCISLHRAIQPTCWAWLSAD